MLPLDSSEREKSRLEIYINMPNRFIKASIFFVALLVVIMPSMLLAEIFQGKVIGVSDGDSITVMRSGVGEKIRLNGIDAPEKSQDFGQAAKRFVSNVCFGKVVTVQSFGTDKYGRRIGDVTLENKELLNHLIIKNGYAWWYRKYAPNDPVLSGLEAEAKSAKRGLWSQSGAIPPWEFRDKR